MISRIWRGRGRGRGRGREDEREAQGGEEARGAEEARAPTRTPARTPTRTPTRSRTRTRAPLSTRIRANLAMVDSRKIPQSPGAVAALRGSARSPSSPSSLGSWGHGVVYPWANRAALQMRKNIEYRRLKKELESARRAAPRAPAPAPRVEAISPEQRRGLESVLARPLKEPLGDAFKTTIYVEDIQRLARGRWLNDSIIDVYLQLITQNTETFAFTTFFYPKLRDEGPKGVARWAKKKKLKALEVHKILVPVNFTDTHWCLAVIDNRARTLCYFDSLGSPAPDVLENLSCWLLMEADKARPAANNRELLASYEHIPLAECPRQKNGMDCGVFVCQNALYSVEGKPPTFSQEDIPNVRDRIACKLLELCGGV